MSRESKVAVRGVEYVTDILRTLEKQGDGYFSKLTGFVILDPALSTLKNWDEVRYIAKLYPDKPIMLVSRFPEMTPAAETFPKNVNVNLNGVINIGKLARAVMEYESYSENVTKAI